MKILNRKRSKLAQQEMVGFVLIVVVVVIAAMVFLVINLRQDSDDVPESVEVLNLISAVNAYTTNCAISYEPNYDNIEDLIVSCADNDICFNLNNTPACDILNSSLVSLMDDLIRTESQISAYQIDILKRNEEIELDLIPRIFKGNCTGSAFEGQKLIPSGVEDIFIRIRLCRT